MYFSWTVHVPKTKNQELYLTPSPFMRFLELKLQLCHFEKIKVLWLYTAMAQWSGPYGRSLIRLKGMQNARDDLVQ